MFCIVAIPCFENQLITVKQESSRVAIDSFLFDKNFVQLDHFENMVTWL